MGEVYGARDNRLERDVAVKVLPPHLADDPLALARFELEAEAIAALSHPNWPALLAGTKWQAASAVGTIRIFPESPRPEEMK